MKQCPVCKSPVIGRSDKKFCSADCRAQFHNEKNQRLSLMMRTTHRILRRNRKILEEFLRLNRCQTDRVSLGEKGFRFDYLTHSLEDEEGKVKVYCYDMAYAIVEDEIIIFNPGGKSH